MSSAPSFADVFADAGPAFDWPANVEHISASSLKTFAGCPETYRRRYLLGERKPPGAALVWGKADHAAAEVNFRQKVESHIDLAVSDVEYAYVEALDRELEEAGGLNELDWSRKFEGELIRGKVARGKAMADVKDRGVKLARVYHQDVAPLVQPIAVEEKFTIQPAWSPVPVIGFIDVIAETARPPLADLMAQAYGLEQTDPGKPNRRIIDRKTSGKKVSKIEPEWNAQGAIYQLAHWLPFEVQVSVKGKRDLYVVHGLDELTVKASPARKRWVEKIVQSLLRELSWCYLNFGADEPWPATRALFHQWRCGFCGFEPDCPWRKGSG